METLCGLFGKSKQAYYKHKRKSFSELEIEREVLSIVATYRAEMPLIGGLKLYYLTRSVLGDALDMGRDKFLNLLHRHKLIIPPRKSHHTTNSNHIYFKYPNLVKELVITYVNQLWVCDITYIYTVDDKFCYLHLVTDAFSRMVIGYVLRLLWKPSTLLRLCSKPLAMPVAATCAEPSTIRIVVSSTAVTSISRSSRLIIYASA